MRLSLNIAADVFFSLSIASLLFVCLFFPYFFLNIILFGIFRWRIYASTVIACMAGRTMMKKAFGGGVTFTLIFDSTQRTKGNFVCFSILNFEAFILLFFFVSSFAFLLWSLFERRKAIHCKYTVFNTYLNYCALSQWTNSRKKNTHTKTKQ